ncbi:MAG: phosphatase PAP2 family protein [Candidatus Cyclobacteriaceae bacterium M2_1C_046]
MIFSKVKGLLQKHKKNLAFIITLGAGLLISGLLVNAFLELLEELSEQELAPFDDAVAGFVKDIRSGPLTDFFTYATKLSDQEFYFIATPILAVIIYFIYGRLTKAVRLTLVLIVASTINLLLKDFIERPRPKGEHLVEVSTASFPSGHTVSSVAFYGFLIYIFWMSDLNRIHKIWITVLLGLIILSVGFSRIYLGVHYTTDVIAGFLAGGFFLLIFILSLYIARYVKKNKNSHA